MKQSTKYAMSVLMIFSATQVMAGGSTTAARPSSRPGEKAPEFMTAKEKLEAEKKARIEAQRATEVRVNGDIVAGLSAVNRAVSGADYQFALGKDLNYSITEKAEGKDVKYFSEAKTTDVARVIIKAAADLKALKASNGISEVEFLARQSGIKDTAEFLSLAKLLSPIGSKEYGAYIKQLELIDDILNKMSDADRESHFAMMRLTVAKSGPEVTADQAFLQAFREKYPTDYLQRLLDLLGCKYKA